MYYIMGKEICEFIYEVGFTCYILEPHSNSEILNSLH